MKAVGRQTHGLPDVGELQSSIGRLQTTFAEMRPRVSPDGRWMAYVSDESGAPEVYVRPYPNVDEGKWLISRSGGDHPLWSRDGDELFYLGRDSMMAVSVRTDPTFRSGEPVALFGTGGFFIHTTGVQPYDVAPDGRFLMMRTRLQSEFSSLVVVDHWRDQLQRLAPTP